MVRLGRACTTGGCQRRPRFQRGRSYPTNLRISDTRFPNLCVSQLGEAPGTLGRGKPSPVEEVSVLPDNYRSPLSGPFRIVFLSLRAWLDGLSDQAVWRLVVGSIAAIALGDYFSQQVGVRLGPLYLMPITLTCWRLNLQIGLALGFLAALIVAITTCIVSPHQIPIGAIAGNLALNAFSLGMIAGIVATARHSVEGERHTARRDDLTGALTRVAFEQQAETMMATAAAQLRPLLLAYLDLDGFKSVNDGLGHDAGDRVLRCFGAEARAALAPMDCFARLGGDEFAALVSLASAESALETAERLHGRLTEALAATGLKVTCSMGVLIVPPEGRADLDSLMREADRLMYAVKHGGKGGIRLATLAPPLAADLELLVRNKEPSASLRPPIRPVPTLVARDIGEG